MLLSELDQATLDKLLQQMELLKQQNAEYEEDLTIIKKSCFSLLGKFGVIDEHGNRAKPKKLQMLKDVTGIVYEAFSEKEDTFISRVFTPMVPFAKKYAHLK